MNPWPFVIAAYAIAFAGSATLFIASFRDKRGIEGRAKALRQDPEV